MADSAIHNSQPTSTSLPPGGILLAAVKPGTVLEVQTRNNRYTLVPQPSGDVVIWGHPEYCPAPVIVNGLGIACAQGLLREGFLCLGSRLSFPIDGRRINTSRILSIESKLPN